MLYLYPDFIMKLLLWLNNMDQGIFRDYIKKKKDSKQLIAGGYFLTFF
jgi:hypothetical protein